MTGQEFAAAARRKSGTNSTTFTDSNLLSITNEAKNDLVEKIVERNKQYFTVPVLADLVASSASNLEAREYPWPDDILSKIVTVEVAFVVESPLKYQPIKPYPGGMERLVDNIGGITEANIIANFSNDDANLCSSAGCGAFYVFTRRGIYILSGTLVAVTNGFKLRYRSYTADLANFNGTTGLHIDPSSTTFGMPLQFHNLWNDLAVIKFKTERPNPLPLNAWEQGFSIRLKEALDSIAQDDQRGEDFGELPPRYNNGFNL